MLKQAVVVYRKEKVFYDLESDSNWKYRGWLIKYLIDDGHMVTVVWEQQSPTPEGEKGEHD